MEPVNYTDLDISDYEAVHNAFVEAITTSNHDEAWKILLSVKEAAYWLGVEDHKSWPNLYDDMATDADYCEGAGEDGCACACG
jgi:hypothetical protein